MPDISTSLLDWYDQNARQLPWRSDISPYRTWVSEIMLQQTQVDTVIPYFERFILRFPDLPSLARASQADVLREWEGLGYYGRARNLHKAAQLLCQEHNCQLPADVEALRRLPGIGRYTAGAIASIAFGIAAPALDANIRRVLSRLRKDSLGSCRAFSVSASPGRPQPGADGTWRAGVHAQSARMPALPAKRGVSGVRARQPERPASARGEARRPAFYCHGRGYPAGR